MAKKKHWFDALSPEARKAYLHNHPNSKLRKKAGKGKPLPLHKLAKLQDERLRKARYGKRPATKQIFI